MSSLFAIPAIRNAARAARLLFVPFPLAMAISWVLVETADHLLRPDRSNIVSGEPGEYLGGALLIMFCFVLQLVLGGPLLLILDSLRARTRTIIFTGVALAIGCSSFFALVFQAPQFGETFLFLFPLVFGFFGLPLIGSYALAAWPVLRVWQEGAPSGRGAAHHQ
jgi:hypothetical protein